LDDKRRAELTNTLAKKLAAIEGVLTVMRPGEFVDLGVPDPSKNPEAPHLVLTTGPGYSFANNVTGPAVFDTGGNKGSHGHDPRPDSMHAMFVAAGTSIKTGTKLNIINNVDIAPTIAHLLGLEMATDGRILKKTLAR